VLFSVFFKRPHTTILWNSSRVYLTRLSQLNDGMGGGGGRIM
jgi:hypothetical protein